MSIPEIDSAQSLEALADDHLQQELRSLFAVDTQHYLQKYSQIAQSLQAQSWRSDIQELYRCVHTIKGGAVTIGAEAVLKVATALEDVLADLRYLELAPSLADGHLSLALIEAGELLTGSLEPQQQAEGQEPILSRIRVLHQEIRERYLPQWDEVSQLHQAFAEEGLDLVVLELDIALERLPEQGTVPDSTVQTAQQILEQLAQIGQELHLAMGWTELLQHAQPLLEHRNNTVWRSQWSRLFQALKTCAKQSGKPVPFEFDSFQPTDFQSTSAQFHPLEAREDKGWVMEGSADLGLRASARSKEPESKQPESERRETDSLQDGVGETGIGETGIGETGIGETEMTASVGSLLDALNPVEVTEGAERVDCFAEPFLDDGASLADTDPYLNENSFVGDRQTFGTVPDPRRQVDQLDDESNQDWLVHNFLDALTPPDAISVPHVIDALGDAFASEDTASLAGEALHPDELQPLDNHWELQPESDSLTQPGNPQDAEPELDWLAQTSLIDPATALRSPRHGQGDVVDGELSLLPASVASNGLPTDTERAIEPMEKVQIPVPLEALDQSAQHLVETLLTLRTTQGFYQALQSQITQIMTLAHEGTQYITQLRQIQDDYTLLEELSHSAQATVGPTPERYRQGYTVINRLLETSLRLSEIGAETGKTTQQIATYLQNIDRNVLRLQSTIEDSRLVSFQNLSFRAKAILRDLTTRYNKPAKLLIQGEKTELDVTIARLLEPALLHLIRNAYDHGLESPTERAANGKPEQGTIKLSLVRQGNRFQFEIQDDGRGMNANAIQARAEALNLPLCKTQTFADLLSVICQPGFSAQTQVSELSGRGVGMDVVVAQVARLGGRLSLRTAPGRGTTFQIQFPVPRLLVPCVLLQVGDQTVAIPEDDIRTITLLSNLDVSSVEETSHASAWTIRDEAGSLPAVDLLKYWQPQTGVRTLADTTVGLYVAIAGIQQGVWLLADQLLEQAALMINPIPQPLATPNGLIGVSLQPNGSLVPVLEAQAVAEQLLTLPAPSPQTASITPSEPHDWNADVLARSILIVDDAALMRRRIEASLNGDGYLTHTCADGQEAWHWLQAHPRPSLVITDIEMPNMDGFTLVDRCRQAGIDMPILVVSSRLSEEWFDEARRLGANDYLTKGFSTADLLRKVNALLNPFVLEKLSNPS